MINLSPHGQQLMLAGVTSPIAKIHLYIESGELEGHGYAPQNIDAEKWDGPAYPEIVWEFSAGERVMVLGYFVTDAGGNMIFTEDFDEPMKLEHNGDRITVHMRMRLIGGI